MTTIIIQTNLGEMQAKSLRHKRAAISNASLESVPPGGKSSGSISVRRMKMIIHREKSSLQGLRDAAKVVIKASHASSLSPKLFNMKIENKFSARINMKLKNVCSP